MRCYIVIFEKISEESRKRIKDSLASYKTYCPINSSCWAIKTNETAVQIRDKLMSLSDKGGRIFVIRSGTEAAWVNSFGDKHNKWLKKNL